MTMFTFTVTQMVSVRTEIQTQFYMVAVFFILPAHVHGKTYLALGMFLIWRKL